VLSDHVRMGGGVCVCVRARLRSISCRLVTRTTHTYGMYFVIF